jgi:SAM-dependent methyltransferase
MALYVQYGCGHTTADGWRNFDASPTLRFERLPFVGRLYAKNASPFPDSAEYGDIVKGLPVDMNSCDAVYCSHVLEHLSLADLREALRNTFVILKPGGLFRFVLPDLEYYIRQYIADPDTDASLRFMIHTGLGCETRTRGLLGLAVAAFGNSRHLWMWDYKAMCRELEKAGFDEIRRATRGDCIDPAFEPLEVEERWLNCLSIECRKPTAR